MTLVHWSLAACLLAVGPSAWADTYRCTDATGATRFSDRPCPGARFDRNDGTRHAPDAASAGASCPPFAPREYHGLSVATPNYRQPEQIAEMKCEVEATKRNVELQRARLAKLTAAKNLSSAVQARGMATEMDDYAADARANISAEQVHLEQLEFQLKFGPGFPEHHAKLLEWNERCNSVRLSAADATTKSRCAAEGRALGMP